MIYTDEENVRWWQGLAKARQMEIIDTILEKSGSAVYCGVFERVKDNVNAGKTPTYAQLDQLRKWDR